MVKKLEDKSFLKSVLILVLGTLLTISGTLLLRADNIQINTLKDHETRIKSLEKNVNTNTIILKRIDKNIDKINDKLDEL